MSAPPTASGKTTLLRVTMYVKRKEGTRPEDFDRYWSEEHAPLVSEWLARHGILRYVQYHTPTTLIDSTVAAWPAAGAMTKLPYDGAVELLVPDVACFRKAQEDPCYSEKVQEDEAKFFEKEGMGWTAGWEEVYVRGGTVLGKGERGVVSE